MKTSNDLSHVPVIMITTIDEIDLAAEWIANGADDYLVKPFNPAFLRPG